MSTNNDLAIPQSLRDFIPLSTSLRDLFPLQEVPEHLPKRRGRKLHRSVTYRWAGAGLAGVRLRTLRIGGELHTSDQWLAEFFQAVTKAKA